MVGTVYLRTMGIDNRVDAIVDEVRSLASHADAGGALERVCIFLKESVPHYDWVGFYLAVPDERILLLGPFEGAPTDHIRIPYGSGICGRAAERGETFVVADVAAESNYLACSLATKAEIVLPVYHDGSFVGELDIDSHTRDPFTAFDDALLAEVVVITARHVARVGEPFRGRAR